MYGSPEKKLENDVICGVEELNDNFRTSHFSRYLVSREHSLGDLLALGERDGVFPLPGGGLHLGEAGIEKLLDERLLLLGRR